MSERSTASWIRGLAVSSLVLVAVAIVLEISRMGRLIAAWPAEAAAITMLSLAGLAALASHKAIRALAARLEMLGWALDSAPDAQLIVATDGGIQYANRAFRELFPGPVELPMDRVRQTLCSDAESEAQFRRLRGRAAAGVSATAILSSSKTSTSDPGHLKVRIDPIAGYPGFTYWSVQDVSASHRSEAALREERNILASLLDNAPIGFYSVDDAGRFRFANRTLAQWLGSTPSELLTGSVRLSDFLACPPAAGTPAWNPFRAQGAGAQRGEVVLKTCQGRIVPAWIAQNVVGSGAELHTRSVVCDLTPEREWKTALRSFERFRRCFANAPVGIALLDRTGCFEEANRAVGELFGATPQYLKGRQLIELLNAKDRDRISARLAAAADGPADPEPVEVRPTRPGDKTLVLFLGRLDDPEHGALRSDASTGDPSNGGAGTGAEPGEGLTLHFIDVTEQKNLEIQFAQSQKMQAIGQLAGGVAHDFNNLLTAMIGFCDLLLLRSPPSDPSFADIMQIKQNANRAANLVRQLLAFSRQQTLQPRVLNITDVLYELRHLIERLIGEHIDLKVVHGRDLGFVRVDQGQFEQVVINLAVNARDAMPGGGTLTIRTANVHQERQLRRGHESMPAGTYVLIEMADTGVGIPKENLARIFDPFFSTKQVGSGTGLGLSTVYGIVKQTGGFVFASSAPGQGAVFQIYLPRCEPADAAQPARSGIGEVAAAQDLTGHGTIMLVEDDDPVRIFGARALRNKGYKVIEARSGEAALDLIRNAAEPINLLITDVVMPHMDGPGLVREVRDISPEMKVIFISGYTEDAFRQRLDSDVGIEFLSKPFSLKELAAKVRDVLAAGVA
ncbi:MAG TPA: PAS domain-containing protein [Stellaceae bacterium]|nr:PAS domain-containing protein [Stellaceae bacterium]